MTKDEFKVLAMAMKSVYPSDNFLPDEYSMKVWYRMLQDLPYEAVNIAVHKHIATNRFPPTVADIRKLTSELSDDGTKDWGEAWETVRDAIKRYGSYRPDEALSSLDDTTRECVKRLGFKELCLSENPGVDRANFRMIYEQVSERKKEQMQLPVGLQNDINRLFGTEQKKLEGTHE